MIIKLSTFRGRATALLASGTILSGIPAAAFAQSAPAATPSAAPVAAPRPAPAQAPAAPAPGAAPVTVAPAAPRIIRSLRVEGSQRIEPETVLSYTQLRQGQPYTNESLDQALRDLLASELFADVTIEGAVTGEIVVRIRENPIINRVVFEGNSRLKTDRLTREVHLAPRQIFTRSAVRADVNRIIELYRRQGRFAAVVNPQMVALDQNRVDVIFAISEGPKSRVRQINIIGNEAFSDGQLRGQMATRQARLSTILSPNTSYDADRLQYDQQKLRQFYLTQGYADFRVTSAVAELTPDRRDFIITYVVEEGPRYKFGDVTVDSDIRDFDNTRLAASLGFHRGEWYNAKRVEDAVDSLNQSAGLFGYAFADVEPQFQRDAETHTMGINFHIAQSQRTYVERVEVNGNTQTQDRVIRREIRLAEGDAFNSFAVRRSQDRINSLGYFQDRFEIHQRQGSSPDRVVLEANVTERPTGELSLSAGYSSIERFVIQGSIRQRNFRGMGQELRASVDYSTYSKSINLGFTEPYLFGRNVALGFDVFRRDYNSFNTLGDDRRTTYSQVTTGFQVRAGVPLTEYMSLAARYQLSYDKVGLDEATYFTNGQCNILIAGRYLCEAIGNRLTSAVGYSLIYDSRNSRLRPTAGSLLSLSQDVAGLGGDVRYIKTQFNGARYWGLGSGFVLSANGEGGYIHPLEHSRGAGIDAVRITDRFYLGEPDFRGFDIRGVGPRVQRIPYITDASGNQVLQTDRTQIVDDALGGRAYYLGRLELEIPLGAGARELGLRPSIYVQAGALFDITRPLPTATFPTAVDPVTGRVTVLPINQQVRDTAGNALFLVPATDATNPGVATTCQIGFSATAGGTCVGTSVNTAYTQPVTPFLERFLGNSARPRVTVGAGVNWNSPFGPLRIDAAYALVRVPGDDTKIITFNVGTQF